MNNCPLKEDCKTECEVPQFKIVGEYKNHLACDDFKSKTSKNK